MHELLIIAIDAAVGLVQREHRFAVHPVTTTRVSIPFPFCSHV
jgi:hypothetical protein